MSWEIIKVLEVVGAIKDVVKFIQQLIKKDVKKDMETCMEVERKPTHSCYDLRSMGQCISQTYDLLVYRKLAPGKYGLEPREMPQELAPGESLSIPLNFAWPGALQLTVRGNVSSEGAPVKLALLDKLKDDKKQEIWATPPSTQIKGTYIVDLKAPGSYELRIENPSSANARISGTLYVTMCSDYAVESWLWLHAKFAIESAPLNGVKTPMAPMGIAIYGIKEDRGQYSTYRLTTDAVRGVVYIPPNISVSGYWRDGTYYGRAFSVRLSAIVVARLADGTVQYYLVQNAVFEKSGRIWNKISNRKRLKVRSHIENVTTVPPILDNVRGRDKIYNKLVGHGNYYEYVMPGSIPFGRIELEIRTRVADGKIIVEFCANGQKYDEVTITPRAPPASACIEVAPDTTPIGYPLDLELVFTGYNFFIPFAVLNDGSIILELYVRKNGKWEYPPSAWSVGSVTGEASYARVEPRGVGSAIVKPGTQIPLQFQLWDDLIDPSRRITTPNDTSKSS